MSNSPPPLDPLLAPGDLTRRDDPSPKGPIALPKGFRFCPSDEELVANYLEPKVKNEPLTAYLIGEVDLYKYEPWDLPREARIPSDSEWYFFSRPHEFNKRRISRKTKKGYWRPTGEQTEIWQAGILIGSRRTFAYHFHPQPHGQRTHWIMYEYQLEDEEISKDLHVLCVIKEKKSDVAEEHGYLPIDFQQVEEVLEPLQISSLVNGSLIFGRENEKRIIVNFIRSHATNNRNPAIICIVGASGLGKTTMLHLLYNDESVSDAFDMKVFLCMSKRFDERRLLKDVLQSLMCSCDDIDELSILEDIVKEELMEKKLLLVLDNAENQNQNFWKYVSMLINAGSEGSLALVARQNHMVGDVMQRIHICHLNKLSYFHFWAILKHQVFGSFHGNISPELETIGKVLLKKCNYNPFCIKVLGSLLSQSFKEQWWVSILKSNAWETTEFGDDIPAALRVCYDFLPTDLKRCFSYCSLLPRNCIFHKNYIIRLWISQGFVVSVQGTEPEDIGIQYFDELVQRSFFQNLPICNVKKDKFIMHEFIHCLAENVACRSCFRSEDGVFNTPDVSHLSLIYSEPQIIAVENLAEHASQLHTCLFINQSRFQLDGIFPIFNLAGLNDLFKAFGRIIALDLSCINVTELPDSIGLLQSLHFLGINNTKIKHLPKEVCTLVNIQTIEARNCDHLAELPKNLCQLTNLRHLDVWKDSGYVLMPFGIGKLINLQKLETFHIGSDSSLAKVSELKNMSNLGSHLRITGLENVRSTDEAIEAALKHKRKIKALTLQWSDDLQYIRSETDIAFTEKILRNLEPNNNLHELIVQSYTGLQFPTWIGDPLFNNLVSIIISRCLNCKKFPQLGQLPSLKYLSLQKMRCVQKLVDSSQRSLMKGFPMFRSLEQLNLSEMYDLEELFEIEDGDCPCLRMMSINRCSLLRIVPRLPSLTELSLHCCARFPEIACLSSLEILKIENFQNIEHIYLPPNLTVLKRLELSYCSELLSVEGLLKLTKIEKILLVHCPKIDLLHNHEQYNFKKVNSTRLKTEICRPNGSRVEQSYPKDNKLEKGLAENKKLKRELYEESSCSSLVESNKELQAMENMLDIEVQKRTEIEENFARQSNELVKANELVSSLKSRNMQLHHTVAELQTQKATYKEFTDSEIKEATRNFDKSLIIEEGRYGSVYRGYLLNTMVAIKRIRDVNSQHDSEFFKEIEILGQLRHPNLVTLIGVCAEARALVYEDFSRGSLDKYLYYKDCELLSWQIRVRIACEVCSALIFLHSSFIVHGDVKPENILLSYSFTAKLSVSDFSKSQKLQLTSRSLYDTQPKGALAYMDPEYLGSGELAFRSDVYSFGIVLLQLVTGKEENTVKEAMRQRDIEKLIDQSAGWPLEQAKKIIQIALRCNDPFRSIRPDLGKEVWFVLESIANEASSSQDKSWSALEATDSQHIYTFFSQLVKRMSTELERHKNHLYFALYFIIVLLSVLQNDYQEIQDIFIQQNLLSSLFVNPISAVAVIALYITLYVVSLGFFYAIAYKFRGVVLEERNYFDSD